MLEWFNFIVLTVTLIVLCIYAWDTKKMQRSTTKQVELGIMPLISVELANQADYYTVIVKNIGNGTALNIEFDPMILSENSGVEYRIDFIQSLRAGESREVLVMAYQLGEKAPNSWMVHLRANTANRVIPLIMKYDNVNFEKKRQLFEFGLGERRIKMLP